MFGVIAAVPTAINPEGEPIVDTFLLYMVRVPELFLLLQPVHRVIHTEADRQQEVMRLHTYT